MLLSQSSNNKHASTLLGNQTLQFAVVPVPTSPRLEDKTECAGKAGWAMAPHPYPILLPARPGPAAEQTHKLGTMPRSQWFRHN